MVYLVKEKIIILSSGHIKSRDYVMFESVQVSPRLLLVKNITNHSVNNGNAESMKDTIDKDRFKLLGFYDCQIFQTLTYMNN